MQNFEEYNLYDDSRSGARGEYKQASEKQRDCKRSRERERRRVKELPAYSPLIFIDAVQKIR